MRPEFLGGFDLQSAHDLRDRKGAQIIRADWTPRPAVLFGGPWGSHRGTFGGLLRPDRFASFAKQNEAVGARNDGISLPFA